MGAKGGNAGKEFQIGKGKGIGKGFGKGFGKGWGKGKGKGVPGKGNCSRVQHPDFRWKGQPGCWLCGDEGHTAVEHKERERKGWVPPTPSCKVPNRKRDRDGGPEGEGEVATARQRVRGGNGSIFNFYF